MDAPVAPLSNTDIPTIRVEDWEEDPPLAMKYISGDNELDLGTVYAKVKRLASHPGRGRLEVVLVASSRRMQVKECDEDFLHTFWECVASLLDYFADFLVNDTAIMQSVWFHLLDVVQQAGDLPHAFWEPHVPKCSHAQNFTQFYEQSIELINTVITTKNVRCADAIIHRNDSLAGSVDGHLGGFKAGLSPWQQFMYFGSPGLELSVNERVYPNPDMAPTIADYEQFLPSGALAIIKTHTERARGLLVKHSQEPEVLADFDQSSLKSAKEPFTYSSTNSQDHFVQPMFPSESSLRGPWKKPGLADPSIIRHSPDLNLVDECIGGCKGLRAFDCPLGDNKFAMWHVSSTKSMSTQDHQAQIDSGGEGHSTMFDEWI